VTLFFLGILHEEVERPQENDDFANG
jgi:hypothetical protein